MGITFSSNPEESKNLQIPAFGGEGRRFGSSHEVGVGMRNSTEDIEMGPESHCSKLFRCIHFYGEWKSQLTPTKLALAPALAPTQRPPPHPLHTAPNLDPLYSSPPPKPHPAFPVSTTTELLLVCTLVTYTCAFITGWRACL